MNTNVQKCINFIKMDDEDFEDLFEEADMLPGSSQESLTAAAANMMFDDHEYMHDVQSTPATSIYSEEYHKIQDQQVDTNDSTQCTTNSSREGKSAIDQIEAIFARIADDLTSEDNQLTIKLKARPTAAIAYSRSLTRAPPKTRLIRFPGTSETEAWRFSIDATRFIASRLLTGV